MRENIRIGGIEVSPGERKAIDLPVTDISARTPRTMPVQVIHGRRDGPRLFVCAAIHGDEINGVEIIRRLLRLTAISRLRGTLIAVPVVNVFGFETQSRYLPDRRDLNRSFPGLLKGSLASRIAHLFCAEIVANSTHGIDLHTGALHRDNFPQIRADLDDEGTSELARAFGVPVIINASLRKGSLREAAANADVPVLVYEAGEALRFDETVIRTGVKGVTRVMRSLGMIPKAKKRSPHRVLEPVIARSTTWVRAPVSGILRASVPLGASVGQGELLGVISDPYGENEALVEASAKGIVIGRTNLPLVYEGDALFHIVHLEGTKAAAEALDAFDREVEHDHGPPAELSGESPIV